MDDVSEAIMPSEAQIMAVLSTVASPESDQTITELGYVRTVTIDDKGVTINLQVPPVSNSHDNPHLSVFEIQNALRQLDAIGPIEVLFDDHADSDTTNTEAAFLHRAALERCVSALVLRDSLDPEAIQRLILRDLPDGPDKTRLLQCRYALGLSMCMNSKICVDTGGRPLSAEEFTLFA